jgi:hypothetical protein
VNRDQEGTVAVDDHLAGDLLDRLNELVAMPGPGTKLEHDEPLSRSYLELLGLLPYSLEPVEPAPATKARLMADLSGAGGTWQTTGQGSGVVSSPSPESGGWKKWVLPLAAVLLLALLGVSGWQRSRMAAQRVEIAKLASRLKEVSLQSTELARYRKELTEAQAKLSVLAASGVEVCSLHPLAERLTDATPTATLFVAPDHQHWYLRIDGLEPSPEDRAYQLWFITDTGARVSAGTFDPRPGVRTELTSETMPSGTVAVSVTLEPRGGSAEPSGPPLLYGDEVMRIL